MPSFTSLKSRAAKIAKESDNEDVCDLAEIVRYLAKQCDELEAKVKRAQNRADQAMHR